jgi:hypothetical protein
MQTSSFKTPTPNKIENNFGCSLSFIKLNETTVSVEAITEENNKSVFKSNLNSPNKL